jgi:predicted NUDIX family NTP pyrophosphohydrolase
MHGMRSAGILVYRHSQGEVEVLLVHLGGPFWAKKDEGAWSIPKGLIEEGEHHAQAAKREFKEETGLECPSGPTFDLGEVRMKSGKSVFAWAVEGDLDVRRIKSNLFTMEWPPRSGSTEKFPEIDRGQYFSITEATAKIHGYQKPFLERLMRTLGREGFLGKSER